MSKPRWRVVAFVDEKGEHPREFERASTVMLFHLGYQYSRPILRGEFKKPVHLGDVVELDEDQEG